MRKIIGIIHPFDIYQIFYVYEDGNKIEIVHTKMGQIPETIFDLSKTYNVNQIDLSGAKHYNEKLVREIKEMEKTKYNKNELIIKCI